MVTNIILLNTFSYEMATALQVLLNMTYNKTGLELLKS